MTSIVNSVIHKNQHGFRSNMPTVIILTLFCNFIYQNFEKRLQTDIIFIDFAKAFDTVDHLTLLHKLRRVGFSSNIFNWIQSYLTDHDDMLKVNSFFSYKFKVTCGVPQGSHPYYLLTTCLIVLFIQNLYFLQMNF